MKVFLISPKMDSPNGGIAVWTNQFIVGCEKIGLEYSILNTSAIGKRAINGQARRNFLDEIKRTKRIFKDLKKSLKKFDCDVVHLNSSCGSFGIIRDYLIAKKIKRKKPNAKIIVHFHCDIPCQIGNKISKRYLKRLVTVSNKVLVLCENSKTYLKTEFGVESIKIPNFISGNDIVTKEKKINEKIKKAFFVGRVSIAKGAKEIYQVAKAFPSIEFVLGGVLADEMAVVDKPENVVLLGLLNHEEVLVQMDSSDIFIFPSHTEGFSVALMEAMARGLPSVATDVGANKDMIETSGGIIVPVSDVDSLAQAIQKMENYELRKGMSLWNIEKVRKNYTTEAVVQKIKDSYIS